MDPEKRHLYIFEGPELVESHPGTEEPNFVLAKVRAKHAQQLEARALAGAG